MPASLAIASLHIRVIRSSGLPADVLANLSRHRWWWQAVVDGEMGPTVRVFFCAARRANAHDVARAGNRSSFLDMVRFSGGGSKSHRSTRAALAGKDAV